MKIIVCGGRNYLHTRRMFEVLDQIHAHRPITHLIHGGARGADSIADKWARERSIPIITCISADWEQHGRKAGWLRNLEMADMKPDLVIAFPGGKGTAMMKDIATQRRIEVVNIEE